MAAAVRHLGAAHLFGSLDELRWHPLYAKPHSLPHCGITNVSETEYNVRGFDKIFAAVWLDCDHVLVGTKCYKLAIIHARTGRVTPFALPAAMQQEPEPMDEDDLQWSQMPRHAGIRALTLSPCRHMVVSGGRNPSEALLYHVGNMHRPIAAMLGHSDWIFSARWLTHDRVATGSRDGYIRVWDATATSPWSQYSPQHAVTVPQLKEAHSCRWSPEGVRDLVAGGTTMAALSMKGSMAVFDLTTMKVVHGEKLRAKDEPVCLAMEGPMVVAGTLRKVALRDTRTNKTQYLEALPAGNGVRSISLHGHLCSLGFCLGQLTFHDLRNWKALEPVVRGPVKGPGEELNKGPVTHLQASQGWVNYEWGGSGHVHAVLAHCWDPTHTKLLAAGGPIRPTLQGCFAALWSGA